MSFFKGKPERCKNVRRRRNRAGPSVSLSEDEIEVKKINPFTNGTTREPISEIS